MPPPQPDTLIIVCCHAIYLGPPHDPYFESSWLIEPFQSGEIPTFISHIQAGIDQLEKYGDRALLCFSGGRTKGARREKSEAESYLEAVRELGVAGEGEEGHKRREGVLNRTVCDEWATDSFQNVMCPLMQWPRWAREAQGGELPAVSQVEEVAWPKKLVIVGHEFKRERFEELHLPALRWTREVEYVGIDPPFDEKRMAEILEGDRLRGYGAWKEDWYGQGEVLREKRERRGWDEGIFMRQMTIRVLDGGVEKKILIDLMVFVRWDGGGDGVTLFPGKMPWEL